MAFCNFFFTTLVSKDAEEMVIKNPCMVEQQSPKEKGFVRAGCQPLANQQHEYRKRQSRVPPASLGITCTALEA